MLKDLVQQLVSRDYLPAHSWNIAFYCLLLRIADITEFITLFCCLGGHTKDIWEFIFYRSDGRVHIFGEWIARTKSHRYIVIGPDWACVAMTYTVIIIPSVFVSIYLLVNLAETIIYFVLFGLCIFGLTTVFIADPGLVRKYHHARSRHWTYWWVTYLTRLGLRITDTKHHSHQNLHWQSVPIFLYLTPSSSFNFLSCRHVLSTQWVSKWWNWSDELHSWQ